MRTIHKYPLNDDVVTEVDTHQGVRWLAAQMQSSYAGGRMMVVWAEVDTDQPQVTKRLYVVGTGQPVPDEARVFIGTLQRGPFVFHIWADDMPGGVAA